MKKPILSEQFADNGEHSHWHLIDAEEGMVLWSSFPEETIARGQKIYTPITTTQNRKTLYECKDEVAKAMGWTNYKALHSSGDENKITICLDGALSLYGSQYKEMNL